MSGDGGPARRPRTGDVDAAEFRAAAQAAVEWIAAYLEGNADPATAREAGFERPISHGLNTLGIAARVLLRLRAPGAPERLRELSARFASPGLPGDTLRIQLFDTADGLRFRVHARERGVLLIDRGRCVLA